MSKADDYRSMYKPSPFISAWELEGREHTLVITSVVAGVVEGENNRRDNVPIVHLRGAKKPFVLNKTNGKTIAKMYGKKVSAWVGKSIALYPTTTKLKGETVECIRVRPDSPGRPESQEYSPPLEPEVAPEEGSTDEPA